MFKIYFLSAAAVFSSFVFAANPSATATSPCGIILAQDPLFTYIEGSVLDQLRIQDLAMMRAGSLRSPILIVGEMGSGKTRLIKALLEKAAQSNVPTFAANSEGLVRTNIGGVSTQRQVPIASLLNEIPNSSIVVLDYSPTHFNIKNDGPHKGIFSRTNIHYDRIKSTLEFLVNLKKKGDVTAILTMSYDLFNLLGYDMVGKSVLDRFDIIRMDYGRSRQPAAAN